MHLRARRRLRIDYQKRSDEIEVARTVVFYGKVVSAKAALEA